MGNDSKCNACGSIEKIQYHHISYEPEELIPLCVQCHLKKHNNVHGVGTAQNDRVSFTREKERFIKAWNEGKTYDQLINEFDISFATIYHWRLLCKLNARWKRNGETQDTGVRLKKTTKERLDKIGHRKQSDDEIINMLIDFYGEHQGCTVLVEGGGE